MNHEIIAKVKGLACFCEPFEIEPLEGGITNINLRVKDRGGIYVVRLGEDIPEHGVLRWNELALSQAADASGISPAVVHSEPGILVLQYLEARPLTEAGVRDNLNFPRIVDLVKRAHKMLGKHLNTPVLTFWPFQVIRTYSKRLHDEKSQYTSILGQIMTDLDMLEAATGPVDLVIGHNDLLAANILDDDTRLWLIDWEYGGFNTPLFDLAGLAGNNSLSEIQERGMLQQYFDTSSESQWRPYQAMKCISLMRETLWSMTSELHSELDFDYGAYTIENMDRLAAALQDFRNS